MYPCVDTFGYRHRGIAKNRYVKCRQVGAYGYVYGYSICINAKPDIIPKIQNNEPTNLVCFDIRNWLWGFDGRHTMGAHLAFGVDIRHHCQHAWCCDRDRFVLSDK